MGYQKQALLGLSWVGLFRAVLRGSAFIRTIILARILTPEEFGVFGIAAIVLGLLEMFTETGVNVILIQEDQEKLERYLNTAFSVSILRGVGITLFMLISIPLVITFFNQPSVAVLLMLMSLVPLIRGFLNPALVKFQQQLEFKKEFLFKSAVLIADAVVAIITALLFRTAASLVYGLIAGSLVELVLSHVLIHPRPIWSFNRLEFLSVIGRGKWITFAGVFSYFASKLPDISIGKFLSSSALGYYQMAYRFAVIPIEELVEIFNRVAFPVYRHIATDRTRLKRALTKNLQVFWILSAGFCLLVYLLSGVAVPAFLGYRWISIVPYMQLFSLTAFLISLSTPVNPLYLATKNQKYLTYTTLAQLVSMALLIGPLAIVKGVMGIILAFSISLFITLPLRWYLAMRAIRNV